jgi:pimeloyl-ACP methyl ester carboxylesterase
MPEFKRGTVRANNPTFTYLTEGDGPLALCLHGTQDGCHGCDQEQVNRVPSHCGPGPESELIEGVGHFMMVQRPTDINKRILEFLAA